MTKRIGLMAAICSLALVAAGCGDDEDNKTLSYEDTGTEIGKICDEAGDIGEGLNGEPANDAPILEEGAAEFEAAIDKVRELEVDEELGADRDAFVTNGEEQLELVKKAQADAESGDAKAYRKTLESGQAIDEEGDEIANRLGADACIN